MSEIFSLKKHKILFTFRDAFDILSANECLSQKSEISASIVTYLLV